MHVDSPFKDGLVEKWDLYEQLLGHSFSLLGPSAEHPIMMGENPHTTKEQREKITTLLFEQFDAPAVYLAKNPVLSCFAHGKTTSLVVDSGYSTTTCTPVHEGYALVSNSIKNNLAGDALTSVSLQLLKKQNVEILPQWAFKRRGVNITLETHNATKSYTEYCQKRIVEDLKHSIFSVAETPIVDRSQTISTMSWETNSGKVVDIGGDRFWIPEMLFGKTGVSSMALEALAKYDQEIRKELFSNIIVCGGNSNLTGFSKRLEKDLVKGNTKLKMIVSNPTFPASKEIVWMGGSILASLGTFQQLWISKQEWQETGSSIISRKCQ
jgi:actin-related protein